MTEDLHHIDFFERRRSYGGRERVYDFEARDVFGGIINPSLVDFHDVDDWARARLGPQCLVTIKSPATELRGRVTVYFPDNILAMDMAIDDWSRL